MTRFYTTITAKSRKSGVSRGGRGVGGRIKQYHPVRTPPGNNSITVTTKVYEMGTNVNWQVGHQQYKRKTPRLVGKTRLSKRFVFPLSSSVRAVEMVVGDSKIKTYPFLHNKNTAVKYIPELRPVP